MKKFCHMILGGYCRSLVKAAFVVALLSANTCFGQLNLKVGYTLGFYSPEISNSILAQYDSQVSTAFDEYNPSRPLNLTFGINLGFRYKLGASVLELHWESLARSTSSVGILRPEPPTPLSSSINEFNYRFNMIMLSYESNFGLLGVGSTIGYNFVSIDQTVPNTAFDSDLLLNTPGGNDQVFVRFHLSLNFTGNETVAFAIKPYIHFPLMDIDLVSKASFLGVQSVETKESFPSWGIAFAFYNGRQ